jgi:hypothetical protein
MTVSTDGILLWGYCFRDTVPPWADRDGWWDQNETWEKRYASALGLDVDDWKTVHKAVQACPCVIGTHCCDEERMLYVAIKAAVTTASRGLPERVKPEVGPEWEAQLVKFCEQLGFALPDPPGWWVSSFYG